MPPSCNCQPSVHNPCNFHREERHDERTHQRYGTRSSADPRSCALVITDYQRTQVSSIGIAHPML